MSTNTYLNFMRITRLFILATLVFHLPLSSQTLTGEWTGLVWQTNSTDTFSYQLQLNQQGEAVSGQAISRSQDGQTSAEFRVSGRWTNGQLKLQEVEQLQPASPSWCLKFIEVRLAADGQTLTGTWQATGCRDGFLQMQRQGEAYEEEIPFRYPGRWTGYLSQSDRDYGFYFELQLAADGTGTSHIVSEDAGGEATHDLRWNTTLEGIQFTESNVKERTDPDWKWCLKQGSIQKDRIDGTYQLTGNWTGYLEHKNPQNGACAPGTLFLTKPVLTQTVQNYVTDNAELYRESTGRSVKVDRVLKVRSDNIRIRVWDNGIVDGDVLTLFLNGQQILHQYRVNKRRWSIPVDIIHGENLLILHADDLGDIKPNTVAVAIDDGIKEQIIVLSSNLRESGAILIQPFDFE
jgi:hypothetical protein